MVMKRGFYFSLDSMLASILLVGGLLLLTQVTVQEDSTQTIDYISKDLLTSMTELKVSEVSHPVVTQMVSDGRIENVNNTLMEQIGEFWALNQTQDARNFTRAVVEDLLPLRFGATLGIGSDQFYNQSLSVVQKNLVNSRRMVTGVKKGSAIRGSTAAAFLKKIEQKRTSSFLYFGGFAGQGNLTGSMSIPSDVNSSDVEEVFFEADVADDFEIYINNDFCGAFTPNGQNMTPGVWNLTSCSASVTPGNNEFEVRFPNGVSNAYISGGLLKMKYSTQEAVGDVNDGNDSYWFPGIDGVINLYDGFYTPGILKEMSVYLHYDVEEGVSIPIYLDIGNVTVYESNTTGTITQTIPNSTLSALLNYSFMSEKTVPLRFGFYEGNSTNSSGNISDVFLITSRAGTMENADIIGTTETRMEAAKRLNKDFVDVVLNNSGNRAGLQSYFASAPGPSPPHGHEISNDSASLHSVIDNWNVQNPSQSERALCPAIRNVRNEFASISGRTKYSVIMTDGDITKGCTGPHNPPNARQQSIDEVCDNADIDEITFYTIGFGEEANNNPDVVDMLKEIANCTGGTFAQSNNITGLEQIYELFAEEIAASSIVYEFQRASEADNVASTLYNDSYIELIYTPTVPLPGANEISVVFQTSQFGSCNPTINLFPELRVLEAKVTSYSGSHWTKIVSANGNESYNLSAYSFNFTNLGDPFTISIPPSFLQSGNNQLTILTGDDADTTTGCSANNSMVYTATVNLSAGRSNVVENAEGCKWFVEFESGNTQNFTVPSDYTGSKTCNYTSPSISYDSSDAYDVAIFEMLDHLDFDDNGRVFVDFSEQDLEITVSLIQQVPYLWGPALAEMEVWE